MDAKELIAKRVGLEFSDGDLVNLGIGIPTMVADHLPEGVHVILHSENGFVGLGPAANGDADPDLVNAGGKPVSINLGGAFFLYDAKGALVETYPTYIMEKIECGEAGSPMIVRSPELKPDTMERAVKVKFFLTGDFHKCP